VIKAIKVYKAQPGPVLIFRAQFLTHLMIYLLLVNPAMHGCPQMTDICGLGMTIQIPG